MLVLFTQIVGTHDNAIKRFRTCNFSVVKCIYLAGFDLAKKANIVI